MKYSVILTAAIEEKTIQKAIDCILNPKYSGFNKKESELIVIAPDNKTLKAAEELVNKKYKDTKVVFIQDEHKGKPLALNLGFKKAKGEFIVLTDGDVYLGEGSIKYLIDAFKDKKVGGVTGRPIVVNDRNTYFGYIGHLSFDGAHHKRLASMKREVGGKSLKIVKEGPGFFVMSGYVEAIRNIGFELPGDVLADDAYLTYDIVNRGLDIVYEPNATAYVKFPMNLKDWFKQKLRSVGGYTQLYKYSIIKKGKKVRTFWKELEYFWFPIKYANNIKEFFWSLSLYPLRLIMWLKIFWEQRILKKEFYKTWERVESTK